MDPHDLSYPSRQDLSSLSRQELTRLQPVHDAVFQDDVDGIRSVIRAMNPPGPYLRHQLSLAVRRANITAARCLLQCGAEIDHQVALAAGSHRTPVELLELLLEFGWDVNTVCTTGSMLSLMIRDEVLVEWLLNHGALPHLALKVDWQLKSGLTLESGDALNRAALYGSLRTFDLLLAHGARAELSLALHFAAKRPVTTEKRTLIEKLLAMGFDVNHLDTTNGHKSKGTPLHCAAREGDFDTVQYLVNKGADPSIVNIKGHRNGYTALEIAHTYGPEIETFLKAWSPKNVKTEEPVSATEYVNEEGRECTLRPRL